MTSSSDQPDKKPRVFLRIFLMLLVLAAIATALGYKKYLQIGELTAQGKVLPPPISVTIASAKTTQWNRQIRAIGTLVAQRGVEVSSEVSGVIKSIHFESGEEVERGKLLIELDNLTEAATLESANAQYHSDNRQYRRLLKLKNQSFVTTNDIDTRAALVEIAKAQVGVAKAALTKKRVFAPFSGKLGIRQVDVGEFLTPGANIVTLQSLDKLLLDFTLPESNYTDLKQGQTIEFEVRAYPGQTFSARVTAWNPLLDTQTRNISIRAEVDNRKRLLAPGMFAEMLVRSQHKVSVLSLPETAIFYNIYGEAVYILEKPEASSVDPEPAYRLAARKVDVAYRKDGLAGILKGIKAGDLVVTSGQLKLYPSLRVAIVDDVPEYNSNSAQ